MINGNVADVALKIANKLTPENPDILYNSIKTIVSLIDDYFCNWNISPALKISCIDESIKNNLFPILDAACASAWEERSKATKYIFDILKAYDESYEKSLK